MNCPAPPHPPAQTPSDLAWGPRGPGRWCTALLAERRGHVAHPPGPGDRSRSPGEQEPGALSGKRPAQPCQHPSHPCGRFRDRGATAALQQPQDPRAALTSELTISSGTLCTMDTVAVDSGTCCLPFLLCSLRKRQGCEAAAASPCPSVWLDVLLAPAPRPPLSAHGRPAMLSRCGRPEHSQTAALPAEAGPADHPMHSGVRHASEPTGGTPA